jgi:hypothetical protein
MPGRPQGADASFGTHLLRLEARAVLGGARAPVEDREQQMSANPMVIEDSAGDA